MTKRDLALFVLLLVCTSVLSQTGRAQSQDYDVVVYGGTAGGAIAAIAAAGEGMQTALLEPRLHIGGMASGGLGNTDRGDERVIGGLAREFFRRVGKHYSQDVAWRIEPHVAEQTLRAWLREAGVEVFFEHRLDTVQKRGRRILSVRMENGAAFSAKVFIDATYEGDLMARAGVSYAWGREGRDEYGESLAGKLEHSAGAQFNVLVNPYDEQGRLLPLIYDGPVGSTGGGDKKVQAYNFRLCMSDRKENQVPFPRPPGYDPWQFELLRRYLFQLGRITDVKLGEHLMSINPLPNGKADINNRGAISTDYLGGSWEYPEASYRRREEIWEEHKRYTQGLLYFLANDPSVPRAVHDEINRWGLCKDEFVDTDHWPHQLYVREARRMKGAYFMTQRDLVDNITKADSIGMGSYAMDSHHVQRLASAAAGVIVNEGYTKGLQRVPGLPRTGVRGGRAYQPNTENPPYGLTWTYATLEPYEIPYRSLVPKAEECENLLATICISVSRVAILSIRMEPQYMILGHSGGVAAALAVKGRKAVQKVDPERLRRRLREQKQILSLSDLTQ